MASEVVATVRETRSQVAEVVEVVAAKAEVVEVVAAKVVAPWWRRRPPPRWWHHGRGTSRRGVDSEACQDEATEGRCNTSLSNLDTSTSCSSSSIPEPSSKGFDMPRH